MLSCQHVVSIKITYELNFDINMFSHLLPTLVWTSHISGALGHSFKVSSSYFVGQCGPRLSTARLTLRLNR